MSRWARWFLENLFGTRWRPLGPPFAYRDDELYSDFGYLMTRRKPLFRGGMYRDRSLFKQLKPRTEYGQVVQFKRTAAEYRDAGIPLPCFAQEAGAEIDRVVDIFGGKLKRAVSPPPNETARAYSLGKSVDDPGFNLDVIMAKSSDPAIDRAETAREKLLEELREADREFRTGALCVVWFSHAGNVMDPAIGGTATAGVRQVRMVLHSEPPPRSLHYHDGRWIYTGPARTARIMGLTLRATIVVPIHWLRQPTENEVLEWQKNAAR